MNGKLTLHKGEIYLHSCLEFSYFRDDYSLMNQRVDYLRTKGEYATLYTPVNNLRRLDGGGIMQLYIPLFRICVTTTVG